MITHHSYKSISAVAKHHPKTTIGSSRVWKKTHCWQALLMRLRPLASPWWLRKSKQFSFITGPGGWESNRLASLRDFQGIFSIEHVFLPSDLSPFGCSFNTRYSISIELRNKTSVPSHHTDWLIYHYSVFTIGSNEVKTPPSEDSWSNYHVLNQILAGRHTSFAYVQSCTSFEISTNTFISSILGCKFKPRMCLLLNLDGTAQPPILLFVINVFHPFGTCLYIYTYICMTDDYI